MSRPTDDELKQRFIEKLLVKGGMSGNISLRTELGWTDETYWKVHYILIEDGKIERGLGRGGSVSIINNISEVEQVNQFNTEFETELNLYQPVLNTIDSSLMLQLGYRRFYGEISAQLGRRETGGTWTRPDLIYYCLRSSRYLPQKAAHLITFEIKKSGRDNDANVTGVYEALAHLARANIAFLLIADCNQEFDSNKEKSRIISQCQSHGIGLIIASDPNSFDNWNILVEPRYKEIDVMIFESSISELTSNDMKTKIMDLIML